MDDLISRAFGNDQSVRVRTITAKELRVQQELVAKARRGAEKEAAEELLKKAYAPPTADERKAAERERRKERKRITSRVRESRTKVVQPKTQNPKADEPWPDASVKIIGDYTVIRIAGQPDIDLSTKLKRRVFLKFVRERRKKTGERDFIFQKLVEDYNASGYGPRIKSDRLDLDLFKGQARDFALLFHKINSLRFRIRI